MNLDQHMTLTATPSDARLMASALRWWADAGADTLIDEVPRRWLGVAPTTSDAPDAAVETPPSMPETLAALTDWLATDTRFDAVAGPAPARLRPFGTPGSEVMLITDVPEMGDAASGMLISGDVGALLDKMLGAIGLNRQSVYGASLCPGRPPGGRIDEQHLPWLGEIARHHIALARPKRVWLLGQATSRAILGVDEVAATANLHDINQDGRTVEAVASWHPRLLIRHPQRKAQVWKEMQLLMGGMAV